MQPEKYIRDIESSNKREKFAENILIIALFTICFLVLGPFIHEISHIMTLEIISCPHNIEFGFTMMSGLHAEVRPLCSPSNSFLVFFYSIGYLSTLIVAGVCSIAALEIDSASRYLAAAGSGLFMSILLSIGVEGDIQNAALILDVGKAESFILVLFIILGIFLSSLKTLQLFLRLERKE